MELPAQASQGTKRVLDQVSGVNDPDYALSGDDKKKIRLSDRIDEKEINEGRSKVARKAYAIINKNFGIELDKKEAEIEQIEEQLLLVQKALHLVRYAAVSQMYSAPTLCQTQETFIHPAVAKLLQGKRPRRTLPQTHEELHVESTVAQAQTIKEEEEVVPSYIPPKGLESDAGSEPRASHLKHKRRFVIGNVSRFLVNEHRDDQASHKWMIYVRGTKEEPDLSDVVAKVRFFIHHSYHPNDLIEVHRPPFHLTRRGWGEFPARIQVHFKNPADKPIDVVHMLKLDKTYTGLQTLGAETVVDVWLHAKAVPGHSPLFNSCAMVPVQEETIAEPQAHSMPKADADQKQLLQGKARKAGGDALLPDTVAPSPEASNRHLGGTSLPPGASLLKKKVLPLPASQSSGPAFQGLAGAAVPEQQHHSSFLTWKMLLRNGSRSSESRKDLEKRICNVVPSSQHKCLDYAYLISEKLKRLDPQQYSCEETFLLRLFHYFPLWSPLARRAPLFRQLHPYSAVCEKDFLNFPLAKQRAAEWMRAKRVQKVTSMMNWPSLSTKRIVQLSRQLGFSPCCPSLRRSLEPTLTTQHPDLAHLSTCSILRLPSSTGRQDIGRRGRGDSACRPDSNESDIEVVEDDTSPIRATLSSHSRQLIHNASLPKISRLLLNDDNLEAMNYVHEVVGDLGIKLTLEEVVPGVWYSMPQKLILEACQRFCDELLRLSHREAVLEGGGDPRGQVQLRHVVRAILNDARLSVLTNQNMASSEQPST